MDHVLKRLATHISINGYKSLDENAWLKIAQGPSNQLRLQWYSRDRQNVPDARLFFSAGVEQELRKNTDTQNEADFVHLFREFSEVYDKSGISDTDRLRRIDAFLKWFEKDLIGDIYASNMPSFYPKPMTSLKKSASNIDPEEDIPVKSGSRSLPRDLIEALIIQGHNYRWRYTNLKSLKVNIDYLGSTNNPVPIFNERYAGSMDIETKFSEFNQIMGRNGKFSGGLANAMDANQGIRKLITLDKSTHKFRGHRHCTMYDEAVYAKSLDELRQWSDPNYNPNKRKADTENMNSKGKLLDETAIVTKHKFVREYHTQ